MLVSFWCLYHFTIWLPIRWLFLYVIFLVEYWMLLMATQLELWTKVRSKIMFDELANAKISNLGNKCFNESTVIWWLANGCKWTFVSASYCIQSSFPFFFALVCKTTPVFLMAFPQHYPLLSMILCIFPLHTPSYPFPLLCPLIYSI